MKRRIVIFNCMKIFVNCNFGIQFFMYLTNYRILWCFAFFYLSTMKLPLTFKFSIASLCCKEQIILTNDSRYDINFFHFTPLLFNSVSICFIIAVPIPCLRYSLYRDMAKDGTPSSTCP